MPVRLLHPDDHADVAAILASRAAADGRPALSEHKAARLFLGSELELVAEGPHITGYAHAARHRAARPELTHWALEMAVDPASRDPVGVAVALVTAARDHLGGRTPLTVWAWRQGDLAAVATLALPEVRALYEMRRPLPVADGVPSADGVVLRRFRPGVDESAWLAANNAAFADHRENGALDLDNLAVRLRQTWFDPEGFLLAWQGSTLVGSCWTKLHPGGLGEIYIIGVIPSHQGHGLGAALVQAGLHDLAHRQGATEAMLYVDAAAVRAVSFYVTLGFQVVFTTREYAVGADHRRPPDQPKG